MAFFTFPENARWDPERLVVEFGVGLGEYVGVVRVLRRTFQRILDESPTPERCVGAYYMDRTRFERGLQHSRPTGPRSPTASRNRATASCGATPSRSASV